MVFHPLLPAELAVKSLAQLLHNTCLDAIHFLIRQRAVISAIGEREAQAFLPGGHRLAGVDVEQTHRAYEVRLKILYERQNAAGLNRGIDDDGEITCDRREARYLSVACRLNPLADEAVEIDLGDGHRLAEVEGRQHRGMELPHRPNGFISKRDAP